MKTLVTLIAALCLCMSAFVAPAQLQVSDSSSSYDETLWHVKKRKMIMDHMDMTEAEKSSFWPVYESYASAIRFIDSETLEIISACNNPGYKLEQGDLEAYSKKMLQNDLLLDRVRIQYYKKFSKALSPTRASQFMQLDDNLRSMLRLDVQNHAQMQPDTQASIREH